MHNINDVCLSNSNLKNYYEMVVVEEKICQPNK